MASVAPKRHYITLSDEEDSVDDASPVALSAAPTRSPTPETVSSKSQSPAPIASSSSVQRPMNSPKRARQTPPKIQFSVDLTQDDDSDDAIAPSTPVTEAFTSRPVSQSIRPHQPSSSGPPNSSPNRRVPASSSPDRRAPTGHREVRNNRDLPLTRLLEQRPDLLTQEEPTRVVAAIINRLNVPVSRARALGELLMTMRQMREVDRPLAEQLHQYLDEEFEQATIAHTIFKERAAKDEPDNLSGPLHRRAAEYMSLRKLILNEREALRRRVAADIVAFNNLVRSRIRTMKENLAQRDGSVAMNEAHAEVLSADRAQVAADQNYVRARQESLNRPDYLPVSHPYSGGVNVPSWTEAPSVSLDTYSPSDIDHLVNSLRAPIKPQNMPTELNVDPHEHQRYGLGWLLQAESSRNRGGILSDDMGLGKTVQTIALMYANPPEKKSSSQASTSSATTPMHRGGEADPVVLIVCPVAVLEHWREELHRRVRPGHRLRVYVHHRGLVKELYTASQIRKKCDVVIASYAGVTNEFKHKRDRTGSSPLFSIHWHRVVLDEAHIIRNDKTQASMACAELDADYRLCLTGTPMQNRPEDLYALVRFLRIAPWWNNRRAFVQMISRQANIDTKTDSDGEIDLFDKRNATLVALLAAISLRRTKNTVINGRKIIEGLPSKTDTDLQLTMEGQEKVEYDELALKIRHRAMKLRKKQQDISVWGQALVMLLRLRQQSCHPRLIEFTSQPQESDLSREEFMSGLKRAQKLSPDIRERIIYTYDYGYRGPRRFREELETATTCDQCLNYCLGPSTSFAINTCGHIACSECRTELEDDSLTRYCQKPDCAAEFHHLIPYEAVELVFDHPGVPVKELGDMQNRRDAERQRVRVREKRDRQDQLGRLIATGTSQSSGHEDRLAIDLAGDDFDMFSPPKKKPAKAEPELLPSPPQLRSGNSSDLELDLKPDDLGWQPKSGGATDDSDEDQADSLTPASQVEAKTEAKSETTSAQNDDWDPVAFKYNIDDVARLSVCHKVFEDGWVSSAKVDEILDILRKVWREDRHTKVIVFSSFTSMLDVLSIPLTAAGLDYEQYHGRLNAATRQEVLKKFRSDPYCNVLLTSIKAGNVGLTLTEASRVIIVDPYWNPYVEEQAKDRVYRIGQKKPVVVYRTLVKDTVEDRIVEIQKRKRDLIEGAQDPRAHSRVRALTQQELFYTLGVGQNPNPPPIEPTQDLLSDLID